MKPRLVVLLAVVLAAAALIGAGIRLLSSLPSSPPAAHAVLAPNPVSYLGMLDTNSSLHYDDVSSFTQAAGQQPNLLGYYSGWVEPFNTSFAQVLHQHGIIPFVQIDPTDASVSAIASGTYNDYLRSYADSVRDFGHAVVIGFGHEMNAPWYSWGYNHVPAATFIAAWRHIVTLFRDQGADNVTWLWTLQADEKGTGPVSTWWPGDQYVTWIGIDGYYYVPSDTFASVFGTTIDQVRKFTSKPILLSETSVGPDAGQFVKIQDLFHGLAAYKTLGLVWFDKRQDDGTYHQDWRLEDSQTAEVSFRLGVREELAANNPGG
jgi:mannan endo-1,4-beta-mannosidase